MKKTRKINPLTDGAQFGEKEYNAFDKIKFELFNSTLVHTETNGSLFRTQNVMRAINLWEKLVSDLENELRGHHNKLPSQS